VQLPKKYKGKKAWPMVFNFHGSGDAGDSFSELWKGNPHADKAIAVTPTIPTEERMGWSGHGIRSFITEVYRYMLTHYNVDTDRVYFAGFSAGGAAAFYYPQSWPHLCAAFFARGRLWWNYKIMPYECTSVLRHVPGFFLVGLDDSEERVEGFRSAEAFYKEHDFNGVFHFVKGRGHEYMPEFDKEGYSYLLKHNRVKYPKSFDCLFFCYSDRPEDLPHHSEQYWLKALKFEHGGTPCHVEVEGNHIIITAPKGRFGRLLKKIRLHLNDEIVNLDEPVKVTVNDIEFFNEKLERSVDFLLDWFELHRDPRRLFWCPLELKTGR
jgi:predicted esterase